MAQDRMLRAAMRESDTVNGWPYALRYFWTQLWGYCDDWGRGRRDPRLVKAGVAPIDDEATVETVGRWMDGLESAGVIHGYEWAGKVYFEVVNWDEHQPMLYRRKTDIPDSSGMIPKPGKRSETFEKTPLEVGEEVEEEVEGEGVSRTPPPAFCPKHPGGTDQPCRACGNARRRLDAWKLTEHTKPTLTPVAARPGDGHKHVADEHGYCPKCGEKAA